MVRGPQPGRREVVGPDALGGDGVYPASTEHQVNPLGWGRVLRVWVCAVERPGEAWIPRVGRAAQVDQRGRDQISLCRSLVRLLNLI